MFEHARAQVQAWVEWLRLLVEVLGAAVIAFGFLVVLFALARRAMKRQGGSFNPIRLAFARYLTLALELQLAADILSTSVAPSWNQIGKLAAIAVLRTALNYFLEKEMERESERQDTEGSRPTTGPG